MAANICMFAFCLAPITLGSVIKPIQHLVSQDLVNICCLNHATSLLILQFGDCGYLVCCTILSQDGRISMAGLSASRAKYLAEAIKDSVMNC